MKDKDDQLLELLYESIENDIQISKNPDLGSFKEKFKFEYKGAILEIGKYGEYYGVIELFVPEELRKQGIASELLKKADSVLTEGYRSQVSNDISVDVHYKVGFRSFEGDKELSVDETKAVREEWSSVLMLSPNFIKK